MMTDRQTSERLLDALNWALGCGDEFPPRKDGQGPYWWRAELQERAGLTCDSNAGRFTAAQEPQAVAVADEQEAVCFTTPMILEALSDSTIIVGSVWPKHSAGKFATIPLYASPPPSAEGRAQALQRRVEELTEVVNFVWRWTWYKEGNGTSDAERLSVIKHHPGIVALNKDEGLIKSAGWECSGEGDDWLESPEGRRALSEAEGEVG